MSKVFRARFVAALRKRNLPGSKLGLFKKNWLVYAKQPFFGPQQVVGYWGRYAHKIAISNHRIKNIDSKTLSFTYKDYRDVGKKKVMELDQKEFIRRFPLHILPQGYVRIRYYGVVAARKRTNCL